jgi:hypothetical protein
MSGKQQEKKSGETKKHRRAKHFQAPRRRVPNRIKRPHKCTICMGHVRVNRHGRTSWHRNPVSQRDQGKWCDGSRMRVKK